MIPVPKPAASAGQWELGGLAVNRLGFGTMRLTGSAPFDRGVPSNRDRSIGVLCRAVELGVNHIDTAAFYFSRTRSANELINRALAPYPDELIIATKVGPSRDASGTWLPWPEPEQLRGQVEENLRQLGRDHLDLVYLRVQGTGPIAGHYAALAELRSAGLIRHLGLSGVLLDQLAEAQAIAPVVAVQNRYSIGLRDPASEEVLRVCGAQHLAFVGYFTISGAGRGAGPTGTESEAVRAVAHAHHATVAQVRLAWALHRGPHVLVIPGTSDPAHLAENVAAAALRLTDADLAAIESSDAPAGAEPGPGGGTSD